MPKQKKSRRKFARIRMVTINGHVGWAFRLGALQWLLKRFKLDVVFIQEGHKSLPNIRRALKDFYIVGLSINNNTTYIGLRKIAFRIIMQDQHKLSKGQYDRNLVGVVAEHLATGQTMALSSVHTDPLGKGFNGADLRAKHAHIKQTKDYVEWFDYVLDSFGTIALLTIAAGDFNEKLLHVTSEGSARQQFSTIDMHPAFTKVKNKGPVDLDDFFGNWSNKMRVTRRRAFFLPFKQMDHMVCMITAKVRVIRG